MLGILFQLYRHFVTLRQAPGQHLQNLGILTIKINDRLGKLIELFPF